MALMVYLFWFIVWKRKRESQKSQQGRWEHVLFSLLCLCDFEFAYAQCTISAFSLSCSKENPMIISKYLWKHNFAWSINFKWISYSLALMTTIILLLVMIPPKAGTSYIQGSVNNTFVSRSLPIPCCKFWNRLERKHILCTNMGWLYFSIAVKSENTLRKLGSIGKKGEMYGQRSDKASLTDSNNLHEHGMRPMDPQQHWDKHYIAITFWFWAVSMASKKHLLARGGDVVLKLY